MYCHTIADMQLWEARFSFCEMTLNSTKCSNARTDLLRRRATSVSYELILSFQLNANVWYFNVLCEVQNQYKVYVWRVLRNSTTTFQHNRFPHLLRNWLIATSTCRKSTWIGNPFWWSPCQICTTWNRNHVWNIKYFQKVHIWDSFAWSTEIDVSCTWYGVWKGMTGCILVI